MVACSESNQAGAPGPSTTSGATGTAGASTTGASGSGTGQGGNAGSVGTGGTGGSFSADASIDGPPFDAGPDSPWNIFVSPSGNDTNPGTQDRPILTLEHARDLVRTRNQTMPQDIHVYLADGTYRLARTLALGPIDSGYNAHDVIYTALPGAQPIVSGGLAVTAWKLADAGKNLWSAPAPAGLTNTRQLYVNGVRAARTRARPPVTLTATATGYTASAATMASYKNPSDIEFVYTGGNALWSEGSFGLGAWTEPRCPVASMQGTTITMAQPCWDNSTKRVSFPPTMFMGRTVNLVGPASVGARPEYVENAFEFLGTPGQWYFDRPAATLYYVPRPGEDLTTADVEAPVLESLVAGKGTETMPVHNIVFSGIQFSYATWLGPSSTEGFSEIQANYMLTGQGAYATQGLCNISPDIQGTCPFGSWTPAPGNVSFDYGRSIRFLGDAFVHLGAAGIALGQGSQSDVVEGCVFTDISANGIELGGVDIVAPTEGQTTKDDRIANNHIHDMPVEFHGGVAILMGYAQNTVIANNQIDHTPYTGISTGWGGWPDKIMKAAQSNPSHDNKITSNLITDYLLMLADGGAIYTQGLTGSSLANGQKVDGNVVYGQLGSGHGIYTDNGCTWESITNNVFLKPNYDNWGGKHKNYTTGDGGTDDPTVVTGNWFQQGNTGASSTVTVSGNHLITALDQAPAAIVGKAGLEVAFKSLVDRRFASASAPEPPSRVAAWAGNGFALVTWNPPVFQGGSPVQSFTVTSSSGAPTNVSAADFAKNAYVRVSGLTNGTSATFSVTATNATGASSPSLPSDPVTPSAVTVAVPEAPRSVSAVAGDKSASIHFGQPMSDGGSPVLSYTITASPGGRSITVGGRDVLVLGATHTTFDVVDGLTNGTSYTFTVVANNVAGASPAATTAAVTPAP
jgi:hypothetical protein